MVESNESMVVVNVVNTMLLVLLLVPMLQVSALEWNIVPVIIAVGSDIHSWSSLPAWKESHGLLLYELRCYKVRMAPPNSERRKKYSTMLLENLLSKVVTSEDGKRAQEKFWGEPEPRVENIEPGIMTNLW